ncbi:MAG TPA: ABC transporter permease [Polyangia bacterium]
MRTAWGVARHELLLWLRSPGAIAAALFPALGMGVLVALMTVSMGWQPLALVVEGQGQMAKRMGSIISSDEEAYKILEMDRAAADRALQEQRVAAVVLIPADFDARVAAADGHVELYLNNVVDVDLGDDIRRALTRSLAELDAPQLGVLGEREGPSHGLVLDNPFRVAIAEKDLRQTDVTFFHYQMIPIVVLLIICVGMLGTSMLTARDFELRTAKLLSLSPASRAWLVTGKLAGGVFMTSTLVVPLVGLAAALGWIAPPPGHWPALVALVAALVVMAVGVGLVLGIWLRNARLVAMVGLNLAAYLFFLGGGFTTVPFLPDWIQAASRLVPTSYAIDGLRQTLFYPDLVGVARDLAFVAGCALAAVAGASVALGRAWRRA